MDIGAKRRTIFYFSARAGWFTGPSCFIEDFYRTIFSLKSIRYIIGNKKIGLKSNLALQNIWPYVIIGLYWLSKPDVVSGLAANNYIEEN